MQVSIMLWQSLKCICCATHFFVHRTERKRIWHLRAILSALSNTLRVGFALFWQLCVITAAKYDSNCILFIMIIPLLSVITLFYACFSYILPFDFILSVPTTIKRISSPKNEHFAIIYSLSCHSKPIWLCLKHTQKTVFHEIMVTKKMSQKHHRSFITYI